MSRGYIVPIGGAEEKVRDPAILRRFVELCGGGRARIAVIPTASKLRKTGRLYEEIFTELGAAGARSLPLETRADCERREWLAVLERADGVFLAGGNQLRLSTTLGGTPVADLLRRRNAGEGLHVAGTSAGAAFLSEHMIAFGDEGPTPRSDMVTLAPGLGLTTLAVVDQHFRQRDRIGRLITALAYNPRPIGIGLDEDTAAFIDPEDNLEVAGSGAITIVDPSEVSYTSMDSAERHSPVCVLGLRLHVLVEGASLQHPQPRGGAAGRRCGRPPGGGARRDEDRRARGLPRAEPLRPLPGDPADRRSRALEEWPTGRLGAAFVDRLLATLPGLREHGCSYGEPGRLRAADDRGGGDLAGPRPRARRDRAAERRRRRRQLRQDAGQRAAPGSTTWSTSTSRRTSGWRPAGWPSPSSTTCSRPS